MKLLLGLLALLMSGVAAESIRETETMDPTSMLNYESSGSFPDEIFDDDDEIDDVDDYDIDSESDNDEDYSGSGNDIFDDNGEDEVETTTLGNQIPELDFDQTKTGRKLGNDNNEIDNDIDYPTKPKILEPSNEISMASTGSGGFFHRTEGIVAIVAGTLVGLVVAVSFIVFLVIRRNQNGDLVKKPIYKKTSTMEV